MTMLDNYATEIASIVYQTLFAPSSFVMNNPIFTLLATMCLAYLLRKAVKLVTVAAETPRAPKIRKLSPLGERVLALLEHPQSLKAWTEVFENDKTEIRFGDTTCRVKGPGAFDVLLRGESVYYQLTSEDLYYIKKAAKEIAAALGNQRTATKVESQHEVLRNHLAQMTRIRHA